jgi:SAM-dependent methyltransferase
MTVRINIGCGQTPTAGWDNFDNSIGVLLARSPAALRVAKWLRILNRQQIQFAEFAARARIAWADATRRIPARTGSVDVLYSSHMLEHLSRDGAAKFLRIAHTALAPGGIIRIAVPDLRYHVEAYLASGDADTFMRHTLLGKEQGAGFLGRVLHLIVGERHHQWMYDGRSLCAMLTAAGFEDARVLPAGITGIPDPGQLDLAERSPESVFVEARKRSDPARI